MTSINKATHPDYGWVNCLKSHVHKDRIVKIRGHGNRYLFHGRNKIGFVVIEDYGFTIVKTFTMKDKVYCSSYWFNGKPTVEEIRKRLFKGARHYSTVEKKTDKPYGVIYRYGIMSVKDWDNLYQPNTIFTRYKVTDKAFKSLGGAISEVDGDEVRSGAPHGAFNSAMRRIKSMRKTFVKNAVDSNLPVVEVYALWPNYDPETLLVLGEDYDAFEPLHYQFTQFNNLAQMSRYPM